MALRDCGIDRFQFPDDSSGKIILEELDPGSMNLVRCFIAFVRKKIAEGDQLCADWQNLTDLAEFQTYRLIDCNGNLPASNLSISSSQTTPGAPRSRDPVFEFKKGIKRDPALFTILKDNKQWDNVHRTLKVQTCYQDVDDVLNPTYVPQTTQDIELFAEKQKYMHSVFERILQTDEGKVIVRSHDADRDAQLIYSEFLQVMTKSTEAMMDSGVLLSYLTAAKVSDGTGRGAAKAFVLHWMEKLRLCHELILYPADRLSENTQRALLQTAVQGLDVLRQVQTQCDLQKTVHGTVITFAQCCALLINTATGYDNRNNKSTSHGKSRRSVFNSETFFGDHDDITYDDDTTEFDFDVDATPAELLAFAMDRRERPQFKSGSRMPITRWKALSDAAKKIWDQMEDDDKAKILALSEKRKPAAQSGSSKFSINSHAATDAPSTYPDR
jgi:hypothetical protein